MKHKKTLVLIFDNEQADLIMWKKQFKEELGQVCTNAKPAIESSLHNWTDSSFLFFSFGHGCLVLFFVFPPCKYHSFI
jgi:hypothetical protein